MSDSPAKTSRFEEPVTWKGVLVLMGSTAGGILVVVSLLAQGVVTRSEASTAKAGEITKAQLASKADASEVAELRTEVGAARNETYQNRLETQGVYNFLLTRQRQERLEHEIPPPRPPVAKDAGP